MATVTLNCLSDASAQAVVDEIGKAGGKGNTVRRAGASVVINYVDKRYPLDLADWAGENDHATDQEAARVIGSL